MGLETVQLDYANEGSINEALQEVLEKTNGTLDALFNNGAFALLERLKIFRLKH